MLGTRNMGQNKRNRRKRAVRGNSFRVLISRPVVAEAFMSNVIQGIFPSSWLTTKTRAKTEGQIPRKQIRFWWKGNQRDWSIGVSPCFADAVRYARIFGNLSGTEKWISARGAGRNELVFTMLTSRNFLRTTKRFRFLHRHAQRKYSRDGISIPWNFVVGKRDARDSRKDFFDILKRKNETSNPARSWS